MPIWEIAHVGVIKYLLLAIRFPPIPKQINKLDYRIEES